MYRPFKDFQVTERCVSVIGSGGKTTLLRYLAERLPGRVILTTSTHIWPFPGIPLVDTAGNGVPGNRDHILCQLRSALSSSRVVCLGIPEPSGKLADPSPVLPFETLLAEAEHVLIEADGSAGRPLKAHRPWEPVIPACSNRTICVVGASGIGQPISEACHCPEIFAALADIPPDQSATEAHIADVLNQENLADTYLVNQADAISDPARACLLCDLIQKDAFPCSLLSFLTP